MQSKRSFFNAALLRKDLARFWPLWGGVSLAGSLLPLYILLALLSNSGHGLDTLDFSYALYTVAAAAGPALSLVYALLCAMLVWGYLYNSRSVGMMHTLPVDRTCLFVTSTLAGLAMMLIPYAVVGGMMCLIALCWGFFDLVAAANTVLAVLLMAAAFFGLATFCAMLTGHIFALPVLYLLANFLAPLLETLCASLADSFLIGSPGGAGRLNFLSPVLQLYTSLAVEEIRGAGGTVEDYVLQGFGVLALYGLAGIALLALAWLLYRRRASECAGDVAAFRALRPVFRYGLALLSALTLGRVIYELLWGALFQQGRYAQAVPMAVCMALTGVVGYYAASMLLEKSLRVFRGSWRGVIAVCAGAVALCAVIKMDVFGLERRVPELDEVQYVTLRDYSETLFFDAEADSELAERLLDIHRAIVADRDYVRGSGEGGNAFTIHYMLKNGRELTRCYWLWFGGERVEDQTTYDGKLAAFLRDPEVMVRRVAVPEGGTLVSVMVQDLNTGYGAEAMDTADTRTLYEAMLQDAREGNVHGALTYGLNGWSPSYDFYLEIEYRIMDQQGVYTHRYNSVKLYPAMEHTIAALLELEYLDQKTLDQWNESLGLG